MIKAVCFDLFSTLIHATYPKEFSELDVVKMPWREYESYSEGAEIYRERATGKVTTEEEMMVKIAAALPMELSEEEITRLHAGRDYRMRVAFEQIRDDAVDMLAALKARGIKIGLISNADLMDKKYWEISRLAPFFDDVIFSCDVGVMKPALEIYECSMKRLGVTPDMCLFVGDGGSNEIFGAKRAGMKTVLTEEIHTRAAEQRAKILEDADYRIDRFDEIVKIVDEEADYGR